jgi:hypothetical protein
MAFFRRRSRVLSPFQAVDLDQIDDQLGSKVVEKGMPTLVALPRKSSGHR